jgi:hypothetical protein
MYRVASGGAIQKKGRLTRFVLLEARVNMRIQQSRFGLEASCFGGKAGCFDHEQRRFCLQSVLLLWKTESLAQKVDPTFRWHT